MPFWMMHNVVEVEEEDRILCLDLSYLYPYVRKNNEHRGSYPIIQTDKEKARISNASDPVKYHILPLVSVTQWWNRELTLKCKLNC